MVHPPSIALAKVLSHGLQKITTFFLFPPFILNRPARLLYLPLTSYFFICICMMHGPNMPIVKLVRDTSSSIDVMALTTPLFLLFSKMVFGTIYLMASSHWKNLLNMNASLIS